MGDWAEAVQENGKDGMRTYNKEKGDLLNVKTTKCSETCDQRQTSASVSCT